MREERGMRLEATSFQPRHSLLTDGEISRSEYPISFHTLGNGAKASHEFDPPIEC